MCGINGIAGISDSIRSEDLIGKMNDALSHRGPDDAGIFAEKAFALGHRRLSIIDLSANGHQPMLSYDGNLALVFNGEIYNYRDIKNKLKHYPFKTNSDSEVILAAYETWGKDCLRHFDGMFAFLIYDKSANTLFGARDRLGVKPLYWSLQQGVYLFSSEVRALLASGLVPRKLNKDKLGEYLQYQTVYAPDTIIEGVYMQMPGTWFEIKDGARTTGSYWNASEYAGLKTADLSYSEAREKVKELFFKSVEKRLISDVPFGAFLSGGIDSSAVVAAMSRLSDSVNTFNVNFDESGFSESVYARQVASLYKTTHHEINLKPADFLELIPAALSAMDHPGGDGPNTYVVSKATKEAGITMALSGIGGDEWFGGYPVFAQMADLEKYKKLNAVPLGLRKLAAEVLKMKPGTASRKKAAMLASPLISEAEAYRISRQLFSDSAVYELSGKQSDKEYMFQMFGDKLVSSISLAENKTYLQHTLLRDTDQMSMAHALEVREPFLDHHLVEFVLTLPDSYKQYPKKLLTDAMAEFLPADIVNRKKMGFVLPWELWLRKNLKPFVNQQIQELKLLNILNNKYLDKLYSEFLSGSKNVSWPMIWNLCVLSYWLKHNNIDC